MNLNYVFGHNPDVIQALWCVDSETSEQVLINLRTNEIIAKRVDGRIVDPGQK